MRRKT